MNRSDWTFLGILGLVLLLAFFAFAGYAVVMGVWS